MTATRTVITVVEVNVHSVSVCAGFLAGGCTGSFADAYDDTPHSLIPSRAASVRLSLHAAREAKNKNYHCVLLKLERISYQEE